MNSNPFFSICIPATNRERTITNTLKSIITQEYRDFEVIISICQGSDNTEELVNIFFESDLFKHSPFDYKIHISDFVPHTVEDWNIPLHLAKGKYIAMLEGDDCFLPIHLQKAFIDLNNKPNIGLYFPGIKYQRKILPSVNAFKKLYKLKAIPAPSETIFLSNHNSKRYLYNDKEYNYCPEIDLYLRICLDGYSSFYSGADGVIRDVTIKSRAKWKYYRDHLLVLKKFKSSVYNKQYYIGYFNIMLRAHKSVIYDKLIYENKMYRKLNLKLSSINGPVEFWFFKLSALISILITFVKNKILKWVS